MGAKRRLVHLQGIKIYLRFVCIYIVLLLYKKIERRRYKSNRFLVMNRMLKKNSNIEIYDIFSVVSLCNLRKIIYVKL